MMLDIVMKHGGWTAEARRELAERDRKWFAARAREWLVVAIVFSVGAVVSLAMAIQIAIRRYGI